MQLRPYQEIGAQFLRDRKYALLADEPGLGKTAQAIMAIPSDKAYVLVICPASVKYQWKEQFLMWRNRPSSVVDNPKSSRIGWTTVIINYDRVIKPDMLRTLMKLPWDIIICDEAHRLKNAKTKRTQAVLHHLIKRTKRMWFLTGTPVKNRPVDLHPILSTCVPNLIAPYTPYIKFAYRFCGAYMGAFGLVTTGATRMDDLGARLTSFMLRRLQQDVIKELPERIVQKIEVDCPKELEALIEKEELETVSNSDGLIPSQLGEIARIRQVIAKFKVKDAAPFIEDRLEEVQKVVIFFHHHSVATELNKRFAKFNPIIISGKDSPAIKHKKVEVFQRDTNIRILLGQMQACGEGVDGLQHVCHTCVFVEPSWSPTEIDQCIHRLERMGQKEVVNAYQLVIRDTIESRMMEKAEWKDKVYKKLYTATEQQTKTTKEDPMYLEEKLDKMAVQQATIVGLLTQLVEALNPKDRTGAPTVAPNAGPALDKPAKAVRATKAKPAPANDEGHGDEVADRTEEECRALVSQMVTKLKGAGKDKAVEIIQAQGIEKLNEANQVQRNAIYAGLEAALNGNNKAVEDDV